MKLVLVEWVDSHCGRGWKEMDELEKTAEPLPCRSVGWLLSDQDDCVVVVPHVAGKENVIVMQGCGDITIPKKSIIRIEEIQEPFHASDCAVHNAPATPPGPCDCQLQDITRRALVRK